MSDLINLQRCIDGYGRQDISADKLVKNMSDRKQYVIHRAKNTPRYMTSLMIVKDQYSVIYGVNVVKNKGDLNVVVLPSVKVLYIISQTSCITRVVLYAPKAVTVDSIYSNIPVVFNGVSCVGQLVVPKDTSVSKSKMEKQGWLHYYSCENTTEDQEHNPYQLDFLHMLSTGHTGLDFYFRKHSSDAPQLVRQAEPDSLNYYPFHTNEAWTWTF